ncbi:hypothetical protein A0O28_0051190 [Trichoderma guizhouense]|uniref:Uncharacterized protein n=1 Tax=Trichoderma guizhouense TaxID=1491466 RepID=A0A1T3CE56_9HYPO|nr:hypothetical protein A0O28_0051190 [Trichoderma guizhouense]
MPAKKERKNAKHSGGIAAAVTKQTAGKFARPVIDGDESGNDTPKSIPTSNASSPPINTPEIRPTAAPDNDNPEPSPSLDALSTTSVSASTAPSVIHDWARNGMAASPSNLIALASESPPTQPSSYEDSGRLHHGWTAQRAFMTPSPASPSPPTSHPRRPLSYQMDPHFVSPDNMPRPSSTTAHHRRSSLHSPVPYAHTHSRIGSHPPPLPHQPQAHFYGVSDLDLTIKPQSGMKPGDQGLYFGFDKLPSPYSSAGSGNVVLAGYQGGLEVYGVSKRGLEHIASLKGLRGAVHYAKILPWTAGGDKDSVFPLVALVVHGPVLPQRAAPAAGPDDDDDTARKVDGATSPRSTYAHQDAFSGRGGQSGHVIEAYQTAVEIYSLKTNKLVDVLLQAPAIPISAEVSLTSPIFQPPPPTGAFAIKADAGTVAVCSGATGECWIYTQLLQPQNGHVFACTAKLWTCVQQGQRGGDVAEETDKMNPLGTIRRPNPPTAIFALNGRRIAYCPAPPSSNIAIRAHLPVPILGRGAGISSHTPPHLPSVTAAVDLPISDSVVNKVMREATQELIQGAKWVGQQGLQAWNSYWNRSTSPQSQQQQQQQQLQPRSPPQQWASRNDGASFPPTHGASAQAVSAKDPGLVSIVDVDSLVTSPSIHPSCTFATPLGCSFLSFSPSSLSLFTASSKGDVQTVWDLLRVQHTHSSPLQASLASHESAGPQVRQIAQFSRMTVARIIEVVWTEPQGERLAMVTERGTVHLLEMPFSAFMWPPPRRRKVTQKPVAEPSEPSSSAVSLASGAFGAAYQVAMPFVTRSRQGSGNTSNSAGSILKDSAAQGGRAIAASITSSIGKTGSAISQLRHTGENRVSLPPSASLPTSSCVIWIRGRRSASLFNLGGGLVRTYPSKSRRHSGKRNTRANRYTDHRLPLLPDDTVAPAVRQILELGAQEEYLELSEAEMDVGTTLTLKGRPRVVSNTLHTMGETIPQAEIECSAPYQPFHTDRRVVLCEYTPAYGSQLVGSDVLANSSMDANAAPTSKKAKKAQHLTVNAPSGGSDASAWAFGQDISVVKLDLGLPTAFEDEYDDPEDHRPLPPSAMERVMEYGDSEQIVVTTRRRRGAHQGDPDGDGFFEDDCEVLDFADQRV